MSEDFDPRALLIQGLRNFHNARGRTQQVEIGPSSIGDCRRKVYHQIKQTPETNPETEILASVLGIFIHEGIEKVMRQEDSPFAESKKFLLEHETRYNEMPGHIDFFHKGFGVVVDWKTSKMKNLKADQFPSQNNIWQAQNYGLMLSKEGYEVKKVAIVVIPRDGRMDQIAQWIGDYDEEEALRGQDWLDEIYEIVDTEGKAPVPERDAKTWCASYCQFFDPTAKIGCPGTKVSWRK